MTGEPGGPGACLVAEGVVGRGRGGPRGDVCGPRRLSGHRHPLKDAEVDRAPVWRRGIRHVRVAHAAHAWRRERGVYAWHTRQRGGPGTETGLARRPHTSGQAAGRAAATLGELCPSGMARPWGAAAAGGGDGGGRGGAAASPNPNPSPGPSPGPSPAYVLHKLPVQLERPSIRSARKSIETPLALAWSRQASGGVRGVALRRRAEVLRLRLRLRLRGCGAATLWRGGAECRGADLYVAGEAEAQRRVSHEWLAPEDV